MAERNLTSLGTNINSLATQLMVMMPTAERTSSEASRSMIQDESQDAMKEGDKWRKLRELRELEGRKEGRKE